ncbi:hypothetical protein ACFWP3_18910 [Streptomyces sp. NPDC058525]|uniref:hypothetical protein n=1 Tax=Streptomyces sp. NPDC058525 TaxID=3346538 RepID=UPI0036535DA3
MTARANCRAATKHVSAAALGSVAICSARRIISPAGDRGIDRIVEDLPHRELARGGGRLHQLDRGFGIVRERGEEVPADRGERHGG